MDVNQSLNVHSFSFFLASLFLLGFCHAIRAAESITSTQFIRDGDVVTSEGGSFKLGFFSPGNSKDRYIGIWFGTISEQTVVWVANRDYPVKDSSGVFKILEDGNLAVLDGNGIVHSSSSNTSFGSNSSVGELLNTGNLILRDGDLSSNGKILWQSFDYPSDTFLPNMKFGLNLKTGENQLLKAWKTETDPSTGNFSLGFDPNGVAQIVIWNSSRRHWRSGLWNGQQFVGVPEMTSFQLYGFNIINDKDEGRLYSVYANTNKSIISMFALSPAGKLERSYWNGEALAWDVVWSQPNGECEMYGKCGPNGSCNRKKSPICSCLKGFVPRFVEDWNSGNWSGGCVRRKPLECVEGRSSDGFIALTNTKLPDDSRTVAVEAIGDCENWCKRNCSCIAFAYENAGLGCLTWYGDLNDIQKFPTGGLNLYLRLAKSDLRGVGRKAVAVLLVIASVLILSVFCVIFFCRRMKKKRGSIKKQDSQEMNFLNWGTPMNSNRHYFDGNELEVGVNQGNGPDLPLYGLDIIRTATDDFSMANELGEGGFGHVYKGKLPSGQQIAVKRLSKESGQGLLEFENEVILIAKLQHRNLVRLLGYCIQGDEKLLIYEYMPNKSLDVFLFDPIKRALLDWRKRFDIIEGIARGLLYLHRDSRLRIIHRDLKASNILLDKEMNPKISDFGMARIFGGQKNQENTIRVVGTFGYMSPEYAMEGFFSVKSDVFSFGVILLEIVSGRRNASFCHPDQNINLLGYAWELWKEDKMLELLDTSIQDSYIKAEVCRCIQVGLLCVQDGAADRPTMDSVLFMLGSEAPAVLATPQKPAFSLSRTPKETDAYANSSLNCSANALTMSMVLGR